MNLEFFEDLVVLLFDGKAIPESFWNTTLLDFASGSTRQTQASDGFDAALKALRSFATDEEQPALVSWTDTLTTKVLLGLWGQTPAFDQYFRGGLTDFLKVNKAQLRDRRSISARTLVDLADLSIAQRWKLASRYRTIRGGNAYPAGKVIDMAFFQRGWELS